ncbi:hypothetical protein OG613_48365 (plasmid) [Streptomyces sp. NBC_00015]|uniref:hypothetical protein n=1 Tax=Streptomyces sp. NBC_00015 TaxID=2903611 RepID=UPI002F9191AF
MAAYAPLDEADARYASSKSIHYPDDTVLALPETRGTAGLPATPASALLGKPERIPPLSRKQTNLLTAVLRGIPLLDHTRTTSYLKDDEVVRSALRVLPTSASVVEAGEANRMRPRLLTAVIGPEARRTGYLHGLPDQGVGPLLQAVDKAVRTPLVLRVVYGASTQVPLRALSYVLPAVLMATRLSAVGCSTPYLQVILAASLGCRINALAERDVAEETAVLAHSLDRMLAVLTPGRYGIYSTPSGTEDVLAVLHQLVDGLTPAERARVLDRLGGKGGATADEQTLRYAAAHVLVHDRVAVPLALSKGGPAPENATVIDIGSLQERHFYDVRRLFASGPPGGAEPGALVLSRHSVPPYTMARGGDIGLREFLTGRSTENIPVASAARHDLRLLWAELPCHVLGDAPPPSGPGGSCDEHPLWPAGRHRQGGDR